MVIELHKFITIGNIQIMCIINTRQCVNKVCIAQLRLSIITSGGAFHLHICEDVNEVQERNTGTAFNTNLIR